MPIRIKMVGENLYAADVTPPHGQSSYWNTAKPMSADDLIDALRELGCHTTDIGDAFYEANPRWLHDAS